MTLTFQNFLSRLGRFSWTAHNIIAHPLSEVLFQIGFEDAGNWVHDVTIPTHEKGTGRG